MLFYFFCFLELNPSTRGNRNEDVTSYREEKTNTEIGSPQSKSGTEIQSASSLLIQTATNVNTPIPKHKVTIADVTNADLSSGKDTVPNIPASNPLDSSNDILSREDFPLTESPEQIPRSNEDNLISPFTLNTSTTNNEPSAAPPTKEESTVMGTESIVSSSSYGKKSLTKQERASQLKSAAIIALLVFLVISVLCNIAQAM